MGTHEINRRREEGLGLQSSTSGESSHLLDRLCASIIIVMRTVLLGFLLGFLALNNGLVAIAESTPATGSLATPQKQAKNTASARSDGRSSASKVLFIDSVVASVNDSSILQSKLFKASLGEIQGAIAEGRNPTLNQIRGQTKWGQRG